MFKHVHENTFEFRLITPTKPDKNVIQIPVIDRKNVIMAAPETNKSDGLKSLCDWRWILILDM